jgi:hypothetical protein
MTMNTLFMRNTIFNINNIITNIKTLILSYNMLSVALSNLVHSD